MLKLETLAVLQTAMNLLKPFNLNTLIKFMKMSMATFYRGQPKAGTGYKMLSVPFVFSMSRFQGPAFRCDKIVVIVTLVRCIAGSVGLMFAILRILRKARGNGGYSMFRHRQPKLTSREKANDEFMNVSRVV